MEQYLLLNVYQENWYMLGPGSIESVRWLIFSDGSFKIEMNYLLEDADFDNRFVRNVVTKTGRLGKRQFDRMMTILNEEWIDSSINSDACDGSGWKIKLLYPSGRTKKSSGKIRYIYGQPIERIVELLPNPENY